MKTSEIADRCLDIQSQLGETFTVLPLVMSVMPEQATDWRALAQSLYRLDMGERQTLEPKLKTWLMDMVGFTSTPSERLLFRLRLDNAVNLLPRLSEETKKACQVELDLPCSQPEEAILWALTAFWRMTSTDTLTMTAQEICRYRG